MDISGAFLAVIIEAVISYFLIKNEKSRKNIYLIIYVVIVLLDFLSEFFIFIYNGNKPSFIDLYPSSFRLLKGPLLLLAGRYILDLKITQKQLLHFTPFFIVFICNIILLFISSESKSFHHFYLFIFKLYPIYWASYLIATLVLLHRNRKPDNVVQKLYIRFLYFVLFMMILYVFMSYMNLFSRETLRFTYTLSFFVQLGLLIQMSRRSSEDPLSIPVETGLKTEPEILTETLPKPKYKNSLLSTDYIEKTNKQLIELLKTKKIYVKEDLRLEDVSDALHISKNHLSQCISEGLNTTFYDLINKYRIKEFIELINNTPDKQISELYYECGFRSKATFYKYFRQEVGLNPNDYKKQIQNSKH